MGATIRCWVMDVSIRGKKGLQDRRYICSNIANLEQYRKKIEDKIESYHLWPSRISKDSLKRGTIKLVPPEKHPKEV